MTPGRPDGYLPAAPATADQKLNKDLGFVVQDTWTMNRLTLNCGGITSRPDPELERGYHWEYSASPQHELMEHGGLRERPPAPS